MNIRILEFKQDVYVCAGDRVLMDNGDGMKLYGTVMQTDKGGVRIRFETGAEKVYSIHEFGVFCFDMWSEDY